MRARRAFVRTTAAAAAALLVPIVTALPVAAEPLPVLSAADVTALEPPYGTTAALDFTPTLDAPAVADTRVYVELWSEYGGNPGLFARTGQVRDLVIPVGATTVTASFTLEADSFDRVHDYRYQARISARPDQVANPSVVAEAVVTDTTRNGDFRCITAPTAYDAVGVGTPIGTQRIDTTTGDPFTSWCNNGERHRAHYVSPDGNLEVADASMYEEVSPAYDLLYRTAPAIGDHARNRAELGTATLHIGDVTIAASGLAAEASATCTAVGPEPLVTTASNVARLEITSTVVVGGVPIVRTHVYAPGSTPLDLRVGTLTLSVNRHTDEHLPVRFGGQTGEVTREIRSSALVVTDDTRGPLAYLASVYLASHEGNVCDA